MNWADENGYDYGSNPSYIRYKKRFAKPGQHIPNKNEASLLRRLQAQTGLSEVELRSHKKYRKMLSEEQKKKGTKTKYERRALILLKSVLRELKLPKEHPKVLEAVKIKLNKREWPNYYGELSHRFTAEQIIKLK